MKNYGKYSQRIVSAAQRSSQASGPYPGRSGPLSQRESPTQTNAQPGPSGRFSLPPQLGLAGDPEAGAQ